MAKLLEVLDSLGIDRPKNSEPVSILKHLFGFRAGQVPEDPDPKDPENFDGRTSVSLLEDKVKRLTLAGNRHFHLNVIYVGFDKFGDVKRAEAFDKLDYAIYRAHKIFHADLPKIGIGRVVYYPLTAARLSAEEAGGLDVIADVEQAQKLYALFTAKKKKGQKDGIDAFIVRNITGGFLGISPIKGSEEKGTYTDGLIAGHISRPALGVARTFCHEIGHFLGLPHNHRPAKLPPIREKDNLMAQTWAIKELHVSVREAVKLSNKQQRSLFQRVKKFS